MITELTLNVIREGIHLTIHGKRGTSKRAAIPEINLAGKTGPPQVGPKKRNSWFTEYGPYEKPLYAVTVHLEGAEGGGKFAAPIAAEVCKLLLVKK